MPEDYIKKRGAAADVARIVSHDVVETVVPLERQRRQAASDGPLLVPALRSF